MLLQIWYTEMLYYFNFFQINSTESFKFFLLLFKFSIHGKLFHVYYMVEINFQGFSM